MYEQHVTRCHWLRESNQQQSVWSEMWGRQQHWAPQESGAVAPAIRFRRLCQLIHFQGCIYRDLTRNEVRKRLIGQLSHLWTYEYIAAPVFGSESRDALWPRDWHPTQIHQIQDWRLLVRHSASCIFIGHHLPVTGSPANCWKALIASSNRLCGSPFSPRGSDFSSRR